jgi:predicted transcriptional regulator
MRTTIRLDEELLRQLKKLAIEEKRTLNALIEEAAREKLARRRRVHPAEAVQLRTFRGKGE